MLKFLTLCTKRTVRRPSFCLCPVAAPAAIAPGLTRRAAAQLAAEAEAAKARVDSELLATGRMAAAAEARLREAQAAADVARSAAAASDRRAYEVPAAPARHRAGRPRVLLDLRPAPASAQNAAAVVGRRCSVPVCPCRCPALLLPFHPGPGVDMNGWVD